ncbi:hypothetical protein BDR07DRAFT_1493833 [Suillus spraguei]|nr:hypothetical protein BDR07DRAFT_1493833 [Suillus spraguei]
MDSDANAPDGSAINKAAAETHSSNADATSNLPTCPLPPLPTCHTSVDLFPDNILHAGSLAPASQSPVAPIGQPPSIQHGESLGPAAKSSIMQPPSLQPAAIHDQPTLGEHQECRELDMELPPTLAVHHRCREPVMGVPRSHHEWHTKSEMTAALTDGDFNANSHPMTWAHDADMRPGMYDSCPRGPMPSHYGQGFAHYPPLKYYHDPRMSHAPQPPHAPQPQYHGDYHDAPYRNPHMDTTVMSRVIGTLPVVHILVQEADTNMGVGVSTLTSIQGQGRWGMSSLGLLAGSF